MADKVNSIGAGQAYETIAAWVSARTSDGDRWIGELVDAVDYVGGDFSGTNDGQMVLRAHESVAYDFKNPSSPHARIYDASSNALYIRFTTPFKVQDLKIETSSTVSTNVYCGAFEACDLIIESCILVGGKYGAGATFDGAKVQIENSVITDTQEWGIRGAVAGVGGKNTSVVNCNKANVNFRGGIQSTAGSVWDSVVAYDNNNPDWYSPAGSFVNCASGDSSAIGTGAVNGVTSVDFTDLVGGIFTAAIGGLLDGTGTSGSDIGYTEIITNSITITQPKQWHMQQRVGGKASVLIEISYSGSIVPTSILGRYNGGEQFVIDPSPSGGVYSGLHELPVGNGELEIWYGNDDSVSSSQLNVAIGAKGLVWGQSNFSGRTTNPQVYSERPYYFHKYTVSNDSWQEGLDPFDGATANGSLFPIFANLFVENKNIPLGLVGVAQGSTTLAQWQAGQTLNNRMIDYINNSGGDFEFIAAWIGETDATSGTDEATFKAQYNSVIDQTFSLTGVGTVLCGISQAGSASDSVRQWIQDIVASNPNALGYVDMHSVFEGVHYASNSETYGVASALFDGIQAAFYQSTLNISMSNIPDGDYIVSAIDDSTLSPVICFSGEMTFLGGDSIATIVDAPIGTRCYAIVRNILDPSTQADVFTGITI